MVYNYQMNLNHLTTGIEIYKYPPEIRMEFLILAVETDSKTRPYTYAKNAIH